LAGADEDPLKPGTLGGHPLIEAMRAVDVDAVEEGTGVELERLGILAIVHGLNEAESVDLQPVADGELDFGRAGGDRVAAEDLAEVGEGAAERVAGALLGLAPPEHLGEVVAGEGALREREDGEDGELSAPGGERRVGVALRPDERQAAEGDET
jgi:hypothetical protein